MRSRLNVLLGGLLAATLAAGVAAQSPGVHPISGRRYAPVMGYQGAPWLERGEREEEEAPDVALNALKIPKGASVADIGAGSGYITVRLAARVGPTGRVYANDVQPQMLNMLARRLSNSKITNVTLDRGHLRRPEAAAGVGRSGADGRRLSRAVAAAGDAAPPARRAEARRPPRPARVPQGRPDGADQAGTQDERRRGEDGSRGRGLHARQGRRGAAAPAHPDLRRQAS